MRASNEISDSPGLDIFPYDPIRKVKLTRVCPNHRGNWRRGRKAEKHLNALVRQIPV